MVEAIRGGQLAKAACATVGIAETTYYRWLACGRSHLEREQNGERLAAEEDVFAQFVQDIELAASAREDEIMEAVMKLGRRDADAWKAFATTVEERAVERWGRPATHTPR